MNSTPFPSPGFVTVGEIKKPVLVAAFGPDPKSPQVPLNVMPSQAKEGSLLVTSEKSGSVIKDTISPLIP